MSILWTWTTCCMLVGHKFSCMEGLRMIWEQVHGMLCLECCKTINTVRCNGAWFLNKYLVLESFQVHWLRFGYRCFLHGFQVLEISKPFWLFFSRKLWVSFVLRRLRFFCLGFEALRLISSALAQRAWASGFTLSTSSLSSASCRNRLWICHYLYQFAYPHLHPNVHSILCLHWTHQRLVSIALFWVQHALFILSNLFLLRWLHNRKISVVFPDAPFRDLILALTLAISKFESNE